jgi:mRNA-degrading endonuclease RelE of RelBE toxin-antitoxin system
MRFHVELSREAQEQLRRLTKDARQRVSRAIDEFEERDDSQWSNIKALQGPEWKGRFRKRVGPYRIIFRKFPDRNVVEISSILVRSKHTYR